MPQLFKQFFVWWQGATWGTLWALRIGGFRHVGTDELGNRYYHSAKSDRRFVIYNGYADASAIPPGWFGWMQGKTHDVPAVARYKAHDWEKPHLPNQTGTGNAYRPDGSLAKGGERPRVTGDYEAWSPE
jgi:NADH:ubiquinone oxidoreductase subunit